MSQGVSVALAHDTRAACIPGMIVLPAPDRVGRAASDATKVDEHCNRQCIDINFVRIQRLPHAGWRLARYQRDRTLPMTTLNETILLRIHFLHSGKRDYAGHMRHARAHHIHAPLRLDLPGPVAERRARGANRGAARCRNDSRTLFRWPVREPQGSSATVHALASVWADCRVLACALLRWGLWIPLPRVVMVERAVAPKVYVHGMPAYPGKSRSTA
jgi:hypothetical protein